MVATLLRANAREWQHGYRRHFRSRRRLRAAGLGGREIVEHLDDVMRARRPIVGILLETTLDERGERLRDVRSFCRDKRRRIDDMSANERRGRTTGKGRLARDHLVGDAAQGVEVDALVEPWIAGGLFGRHVLWCSDRHAQVRDLRRISRDARSQQRLGDSKVRDGSRVAGEQDVVGFDVAVDDAFRVRELQRTRDVPENADRDGDRHGAAAHETHPQ